MEQNQQSQEMRKIRRFDCLYLNNNQVEIFPGAEVIGLCVNDTVLEVIFKKGYIFGRQWVKVKAIDRPVMFEHLKTTYRLLFCDREQFSDSEIFELLKVNNL